MEEILAENVMASSEREMAPEARFIDSAAKIASASAGAVGLGAVSVGFSSSGCPVQ